MSCITVLGFVLARIVPEILLLFLEKLSFLVNLILLTPDDLNFDLIKKDLVLSVELVGGFHWFAPLFDRCGIPKIIS